MTTGCSFASYLADILSHEPFRFAPASATAIETVIMSLKNKLHKIDTYTVEVLKNIKCLDSPFLAHIINLSPSTGCFQISLKNLVLYQTINLDQKLIF